MKNVVVALASALAVGALLGTMLAFPPSLGNADAPVSAPVVATVAVD